MKLYCDITRQRFAASFWLTSDFRVAVTQNDDWPITVYLVRPNRAGGRFPFVYDENSGKAGLTAFASISNPGSTPLTLVAPTQLETIRNGFSGTLHLNTEEIDAFLVGRPDRTAFLAIEVVDEDGNRLTSFFGEITVRMASTAAGTVIIPNVVRITGVTGYTGGGATNVDGIVTAGKPIGTRFDVSMFINGTHMESHWEHVEGTTPSDPDSGIILTEDGGQLVRTLGL